MNTTETTLIAIEGILKRNKTVPASLIRSLVMSCRQLQSIIDEQKRTIAKLEAAQTIGSREWFEQVKEESF